MYIRLLEATYNYCDDDDDDMSVRIGEFVKRSNSKSYIAFILFSRSIFLLTCIASSLFFIVGSSQSDRTTKGKPGGRNNRRTTKYRRIGYMYVGMIMMTMIWRCTRVKNRWWVSSEAPQPRKKWKEGKRKVKGRKLAPCFYSLHQVKQRLIFLSLVFSTSQCNSCSSCRIFFEKDNRAINA